MRKTSILSFVVWVAVIVFHVPVYATVVYFESECDLGEPYPAIQTAVFDYDSQVLTTTDRIYEVNPADLWFTGEWLRIEGQHDSPSTITVIRNITNKTGFTWTNYILVTLSSMVRSGWFVYGSASSTKLQKITYPSCSPEFCPYIEFSGQESVLDGESFTVQFDMFIPEWGGFHNILRQNAIPEPGAILLLSFGSLTLLKRHRE